MSVLNVVNKIYATDDNSLMMAIFTVQDSELEFLKGETLRVFNNNRILTSDIEGIEKYERYFEIIPNPETENSEFRKWRILNRLRLKAPFTFRFLKHNLDNLVGKDNFDMYVDFAERVLYISFMAENIHILTETQYIVNVMKPANMILNYVPKMFARTNTRAEWSAHENFWTAGLGFDALLGVTPFLERTDYGVIGMTTNLPIRNSFKARKFGENVTNVKIFSSNILVDTLPVTISRTDNIVSLSFDIPASIMIQGNLTMQFIGTEEEYEIEGIGLPSLNQSVTINYSDITGVN